MMTRILMAVAMVLAASPALADRPVSPEEKTAIQHVLAAEGCVGGKMEFDSDDNKFEIDKTICSDGAQWNYNLDSSYNVIKKEKKT